MPHIPSVPLHLLPMPMPLQLLPVSIPIKLFSIPHRHYLPDWTMLPLCLSLSLPMSLMLVPMSLIFLSFYEFFVFFFLSAPVPFDLSALHLFPLAHFLSLLLDLPLPLLDLSLFLPDQLLPLLKFLLSVPFDLNIIISFYLNVVVSFYLSAVVPVIIFVTLPSAWSSLGLFCSMLPYIYSMLPSIYSLWLIEPSPFLLFFSGLFLL